ncbi:chemotaxis protein CheA [Desulfococcaceae bacterium HSG9]|nr:chemotaxis protein CheA [Desulfococcaceae bacterium HSG9]
MDQKSQYIETFRLEAYENLKKIEDALLDMEETPDDQECIHRLFRAMHTIKGSAAMFGFDDIAGFAHHAETLMDKVREGVVPVTGELVDLIFLAKDQIKAMLDADQTGCGVDPDASDKIVAKLHRLLPQSDAGATVPSPEVNSDTLANEDKETVFHIRFRPNPDMMSAGMDPVRILDELRDLGQCELTVYTGAVPPLESLQPEKILFSWDIIMTTDASIDTLKDVFIFVEDGSDISIQSLEVESNREDIFRPRLGEILFDRGDVNVDSVNKTGKMQRRVGEILVESGEISSDDVESALKEQIFLEKRKTGTGTESMRISSDKLDKLINLVGEIVVTQAHMSHLAEDHEGTVFSAPVRQMERLTGDLRKFALDMRMLPAGTLFNTFRRLVRDLSSELGKEVRLVVEGGQTELDKTVLEKLHEPLVHLIRNSIDHGMLPPEEREQHGKPRKGTIRLTAVHRSARVNITVADDGMGIDMASVRAKAVEKGLISKDDDLSETEICDLLFIPGFSTVRQVSGVSGRGVGMDVVKQGINALGGTIGIDSIPGQGATFRLSLPLTLAIIEGLHVKVDGRDFVIPVSQVETCGELKRSMHIKSDTQHTIRLKSELIPFIRLREFFGIQGDAGPVEHIAAVQTGHYRIGIVVDEILGNIQAVIKPLDPLYRRAEGISGATVMGNGTVALIIDLPELIRCVKRDKSKTVDKRVAMKG